MMKTLKDEQIKALTVIPGVGKSIANDLYNIGIRSLSDLHGADPEQLFERSNEQAGCVQDRCLLYVFRCAVYYVGTNNPEPELLKWWNWKEVKQGNKKRARK
jgi:hypothetical protein